MPCDGRQQSDHTRTRRRAEARAARSAELKDKLAKGLELSAVTPEIEAAGIAAAEGSAAEAVSALTMLSYSQSEAAAAVAKLDAALSVEDMIRQALKTLARQV